MENIFKSMDESKDELLHWGELGYNEMFSDVNLDDLDIEDGDLLEDDEDFFEDDEDFFEEDEDFFEEEDLDGYIEE